MPGHVMLHLAGYGQAHIELRVNDSLFIPDRLRHIVPARVDNAASAPADIFRKPRRDISLMKIGRVRASPDDHARIDEEAHALYRYVPNGGLLLQVVVGVGRDVDRDALLVQSYASERHVTFPANQAADRPQRR